MNGREEKRSNDLFYVCSLIEYIGRKTLQPRSVVVQMLGKRRIAKLYELADVYHCDNIDRVSEDFILEAGIPQGDFDNVGAAEYAVPTHWDIGKVYKRLILAAADAQGAELVDTLMEVYQSWISDKLQDFNSSFYYDSPQAIFCAYETGELD